MSVVATVNPYTLYLDTSGKPLDSGFLYFGQAFQDPEQFPIPVFWDENGTIPAQQPIRTVSGYPVRNGSPSVVYAAAQYSLRVLDKDRRQVFYNQNVIAADLSGGGYEVRTAAAGQMVFNLATFTYEPGANALDVHMNGLLLTSGVDYLETDASTVTLVNPAGLNDQLIFQARNVFNATQAGLVDFQSRTFDGAGGPSQNFTLTSNPGSVNNVWVSVAGAVLRPGVDFTLSGNVVTVTPGPAVGVNNVLIRWGRSLPQDALRADLADTTYPANGAALVGFDPTLNYVAATLGARSAETVSPKDHPWLAKGDNSTIDRAAVEACFTYAAATGKKVVVPPGVYLLDNTVTWSITAGFEVECAPGAIFKATVGVPVDAKLFLPTAASGGQRFKWVGGVIDGRLMPARVSGAPDLLYIANQFIKFVHVEDVSFLVNDDRTGTAGDSALFLAEGEDYFVNRCYFQGAFDAGVYISGNSAETLGRRAIVTNNVFVECKDVGVITKRSFEDHVIAGNIIVRSGLGIVVGGEADTTKLPGKKATVANNVIRQVLRGIEVKQADGTVVCGNRIEDWGLDATLTPVNGHGIRIRGSRNCAVTGNVIIVQSSITPSAGATAIQCDRFTWNSINYDSTQNLITGNNVKNTGIAFAEDANANENIWLNNYAKDYLTFANLNASTSTRFVGWDGTRQINYFGDSGAGPVSTADVFFEKNGELNLQYCVPSANQIQWLIGDESNNVVGRFAYRHTTDRWAWRAGGGSIDAFNINVNGPIVPSYTVAGLPASSVAAGLLAYASNGRKAGEGAGSGTGVLVFRDGANWIAVDTGAVVAA